MQRKLRPGWVASALFAVAMLGFCAPGAMAQGVGGGQMSPEMQARMKAWQKWRESHKGLANLQTMLFQIRQLDKDPSTQLTKAQAAQMLPILTAWRHKPTMSDDQARQVSKQLGSILTVKQLKKMSTFQFRRRGGAGSGPRPAGAGSGQRRPGGFPNPPTGGFNPLNPESLPGSQQRPQSRRSVDELIEALSKRAKG